MIIKRQFDILFAIVALVFCAPIFCFLAIWIKLDSQGPVFFRQKRIGRYGIPFEILKFRTMEPSGSDDKLLVTPANNSRITRCGRILRKFKMDELPQFWNVLRGDMSVVGPRPEVAKYVKLYPESARVKILSVRPGITDLASLQFRDESEVLAACDDADLTYKSVILPKKIGLYEEYVEHHSLSGDLKIILQTALAVFGFD